MKSSDFFEALYYNPVKHPEKTGTTLERVIEVIENVLDERTARSLINRIQKEVSSKSLRSPLTEQQAYRIVDAIDQAAVSPDLIQEMIVQLQLCELSTDEILELHQQYKIPVSHLETDILPIQGDGCWIRDSKGQWYIDMDSNYSASNLGMVNNEIATGLYNQASTLICMKEDRIQVTRARFLKEISQMMPKGLTYFYWQNSGGEAVDKSLKIAKAFTNSRDVVAFKQGFHGRTHGAVAVTHKEKYRKPFHLHQEDWVHFAEFNNIESVKDLVKKTGSKIIIMEMVQGEEAGNRPATQEFINELWKFTRKNDIVIIDDEVQAGFGRTAKKPGDWFACMSYDVVPDMMVIGKSFGGGYPVTAVVTNEDIKNAMKPGYDGSTFGGNPMAMASALIATRQMRRWRITENVVERSQQFEQGLKELQNNHAHLKGFRAYGLMIAIDLGSSEIVDKVQQELQERRVKTSLSTDTYLRFLPPTIISKGEVEFVLDALERTLSAL